METQQTHFLSIKWKAGLIFTTITLLFLLIFNFIVHLNLQQKFSFFRAQIQQQYEQNLIGQLVNSRDQVIRLAELILNSADNSGSDANTIKNILQRMQDYRSELELNWDVAQVHIFNDEAKNYGGWGHSLPPTIVKSFTTPTHIEMVTSQLDCQQGCRQYLSLPILTTNGERLLLIISFNIAQTLLDFRSQTGADIAILSSYPSPKDMRQPDMMLRNKHLNALTSYNENIAYIEAFSALYERDEFEQNNTLYTVPNIPLEFNIIEFDQADDIEFIIMENISKQSQELVEMNHRSLMLSLLGLILVGGSLFLLLTPMLKRLSTVSRALPLLSRQDYSGATALLNRKKTIKKFDEIDILEEVTLVLTEQLEALEASVTQKTDSLNKRTAELIRERDFISNLINTADLIIITLDKHHHVSSFNQLAEKIFGYPASAVLNRSLEQFFEADTWHQIEVVLDGLPALKHDSEQMETPIISGSGEVKIISWLHSSFNAPNDNAVTLSVGMDVTERKRSEQQLEWLSTHDPLTNMFNRQQFTLKFEQLLNQAALHHSEGILLLLDLDHFKDVNDIGGHNAGDALLKLVSQTLKDISRRHDVMARMGGDEFGILLPSTDLTAGVEFCELINHQLKQLYFEIHGVRHTISCSIGLVPFPLNDQSVEQLISNADLAMYQAKSRGKNTWHLFTVDDSVRKDLQERLTWKQKIVEALQEQRFILFYQPIMHIDSSTVSHYEVLLRMKDEDGTIHSPFKFIPVAEKTGLIHEIDHYVLEHGIAKLAELHKDQQPITLSLNLSGYAMDDGELIPLLKTLLKKYGADPTYLLFELTETAAVADIVQARQLMMEMRELGCQFSIDDFGSGFASFRYLRELPVDIVKIDGMFITNITENKDDQLFVEALVTVAKGMGKKTVAEFVENAAVLKMLKTLHVDYAQGYYIGKPAEALLSNPPKLL